jgi:large subunit ribosomal protein L9
MKVILKENIENLGKRGDIINVAAGYGRNYLIPRKLALQVTSSNMKMVEMEQKALRKKLDREVESFQSVIDQLNQTSLTFERKAGDKDVIFGSVSTADIKEVLDKLGLEVEKKKILLAEPIKRLGNYTVPIKIFHDEKAEIKIKVKKEGAEDEEIPAVSEEKAGEEKEAGTAGEKKEEGPIEPEEKKKDEPASEKSKEEVIAEEKQDQAGTAPEVPEEKKEEKEEKSEAITETKPEESSEDDVGENKEK